MKDLGEKGQWPENGIEHHLCEKVAKAGYHFVIASHDETDIVYECKEAGLRYHICKSTHLVKKYYAKKRELFSLT